MKTDLRYLKNFWGEPHVYGFYSEFWCIFEKNSLQKLYLGFSRRHFGILKLKIRAFLRPRQPPKGICLRWFWGKKCLDLKTSIFELAQFWGQIFGVLEGTEWAHQIRFEIPQNFLRWASRLWILLRILMDFWKWFWGPPVDSSPPWVKTPNSFDSIWIFEFWHNLKKNYNCTPFQTT